MTLVTTLRVGTPATTLRVDELVTWRIDPITRDAERRLSRPHAERGDEAAAECRGATCWRRFLVCRRRWRLAAGGRRHDCRRRARLSARTTRLGTGCGIFGHRR